ncbi:MAG: aryl sulfotransferase [Rhodospirillaceae bacterium]|jgi:hypothetical protein|nr:aryl sulfotransferase [Rhodospirillaceae bacterium]MBT5526857.1 aryl sulfotransferase [Rhodospirillaceae bacterium]MBT5940691.1 aryl sulfotransferase [Rhodospirillaceae bacterium]MBT7266421.1 aryl sulfotransferase [Rhodospirillaceae bacterium]
MRILQTGITLNDEAQATEGYTLFSPLWGRETYLIDMAGNVVHQWELPGAPAGYARLLPNGNLFYAAQSEGGPSFPGGAQGGLMREVDWDGNVINEIVDPMQHHDARRLENGNTLYAGWEDMPEERAVLVTGGIPDSFPEDGMYNDYVREVDSDGNTVWQWSAHSMDIEKYPINPMTGLRVFAWLNATFPMPNGDVMVSLRHINTIAIIDRESKVIKWEMTDFSWGGQHDCQMLDNGNIILFANGTKTYEGQQHSRIIEIDPESKEEVWVYKSNPVNHFYSHHISGQERLSTGNTLICEGLWGRLFEVTPAGEIVWEYISPYFGKTFTGDDTNWVFRAFRYAKDSVEIAGRLG